MNTLIKIVQNNKTLILFIVFTSFMGLLFHENRLTNLGAYFVCSTILYLSLVFVYKKVLHLICKDSFYKFFFPIVIAVIAIAVIPIFSNSGWPLNHDGILWKHRIETYVMHLSQFDLFPIWASRDGFNMGTPDTLFYHKTFYYVSAFFYILFANMKLAIVLTIGSFLFVGTWGTYRASAFLGTNKWTSLILALSFIFLNYTLTNWLLRGAMAEFTAMVFVPLLFLEEMKLIQTKRYSHWLGFTLVLLYLSHSIIGYYALFTVVFTLIFTFYKASKTKIIAIIKKISLSAIASVIALLVFLVPMIVLSGNYDSSRIASGESTPFYKMVDFIRYFYDTQYEWFSDPYWDLSVQMDLVVIIILLTTFVVILLRRRQLKALSFSKKTFGIILISNLFFIYLQTRPSLWFYDIFPGASFIQFPWRLLTFIQVLNLLLLAWGLARLEQLQLKRLTLLLSSFLLVWLIAIYPAFHGSMKVWFSENDIENPTIKFCSNGEFLPSMYGKEFLELSQCMDMYQKRGIEFSIGGNSLEMIDKDALLLEKLEVEYRANIANPSEVILPISYCVLTRLYRIDAKGKKIQVPIYRNEVDPRVRAFLTYGEYKLILKQPSLLSFLTPKKERIDLIEYQEEIVCDAETLSDNGTRMLSQCQQYIFTHFNNRSDEQAHSGNHSIKLHGADIYGFTHNFVFNKDYYSDWEASIWRKGNENGWLQVSFEEHGSVGSNVAVEKDSLGWELIKVKFKIPKEVSEKDLIRIFAFSSEPNDSVYFDDLRIKKL